MTDLSVDLRGYATLLDLGLEPFFVSCVHFAQLSGLFEHLAQPRTLTTFATEKHLDAELLRRVCLVLVARGYLVSRDGDHWVLAEHLAPMLLPSSPVFGGHPRDSVKSAPEYRAIEGALARSNAETAAIFKQRWIEGEIAPDAALRQIEGMHRHIMAPMLAQVRSGVFEGLTHVTDAGGGSGALAVALALHGAVGPKLTVLDLPPMCAASKRFRVEQGLPPVDTFPCNFFKDPWHDRGDAYHFSNILHDWSFELGEQLLGKAFAALPSGGKVIVHETLLADDGKHHPATAAFHLLVGLHNRAQKYTLAQLRDSLVNVGFRAPKQVHTFGAYATVVATKP